MSFNVRDDDGYLDSEDGYAESRHACANDYAARLMVSIHHARVDDAHREHDHVRVRLLRVDVRARDAPLNVARLLLPSARQRLKKSWLSFLRK